MMIRTVAVLLAACAAAAPAIAQTQQRFGPSLEASVGWFGGTGDTFDRHGGPAIDGVLAVPLARTSAGTVVAGITGGMSGPIMHDLICEADPNGGCIPDFPTFATIGAAAGLQRGLTSTLSARVMAGAAVYQDVDGPSAFGFNSRIDVAQRLIYRAAIVASVRGAVLPRYEGNSLRFAAFGLGLRIQ